MKNKNIFEICARAIIVCNGKLLVCRRIDRNYHFFPGGHIEFGETAERALKRELKEELGMKADKFSYMGTVENIYSEHANLHHEINLVFRAGAGKFPSVSKEDHLVYKFLDLKNLKKEKIYPLVLRDAVAKWLKNKKKFWMSYCE
jgi:8-oxo-dGTP diphosphatase